MSRAARPLEPVARQSPVELVVAAAVGVALLGMPGAFAGLAMTVAARVALPRRRARATAAAVRSSVPAACRMLAGELRSGAPPAAALAAAAETCPPPLAAHLLRAAAAAELGTDPGVALAHGPPGSDGLRLLAACWQVSAGTGAGLADALDRVARGLAAEERCRREVAAQLAGPRASAAVLAVLPVAGVAMAAAIGADPMGFFGTAPGFMCLLAGVSLDAAGFAWTGRLARAALR